MLLHLLGFIFCTNFASCVVVTRYGSNGYTEYRYDTDPSKQMPLIISIPHGGSTKPSSIPPRVAGCLTEANDCEYEHDCISSGEDKVDEKCGVRTVMDSHTLGIGTGVAARLRDLDHGGRYPHVVICNLHRSRLDANRDVEEASLGVEEAKEAWYQYHEYIAEAKETLRANYTLFIDLHGQTHSEEWIELGYLLTAKQLDAGSPLPTEKSSVRSLVERGGGEDVMSGEESLGTIIQNQGFKAVPSTTYPSPSGGGYYSGGYNTMRYGSTSGGSTDAIQIEVNRHARFNQRGEVIEALAQAINKFIQQYY